MTGYGGQVDDDRRPILSHSLISNAGSQYRSWTGKMVERVASLELIVSSGNVHLICLRIESAHALRGSIIHEGFMHRFQKKVFLEPEYETGNAEFDRTYFIKTKENDSLRPLDSVSVQQAITQLEPFFDIEFTLNCTSATFAVGGEEVFAPNKVLNDLSNLRQLVEIIERKSDPTGGS
jgi:hypothetical protein